MRSPQGFDGEAGNTELPHELKDAVEAELDSVPAGNLAAAVETLSGRYREGGSSGFPSPEGIAAYLASRLPATYAAVFSALSEALAALPGFAPRTMLDAGAGPGTAAWAAARLWPGLLSCVSVERDAGMLETGRRLASHSSHPAVQRGDWIRSDFSDALPPGRHDLIAVSYALGELPEERQIPLVRELWEHTGRALAIVEPGTPEGFARIIRARGLLLELGAHISAPCPGSVPCPMADGWCHFAARVARSRQHLRAKGAVMPWEDEKHSYLVAARGECIPCAGRVLRHPQVRKGHIILELCARGGYERITVARSAGDAYRAARDLAWGDAVEEASGIIPGGSAYSVKE
jgi:ribosomal protein RSM22 (predicted rRNA methylase)